MIYQMAHGRMSGERARQIVYGTIAKTEVAERWCPFSEGIKGGGNPRKPKLLLRLLCGLERTAERMVKHEQSV